MSYDTTANGLWSAGATWVGGVGGIPPDPSDDDINIAHLVTLDQDQTISSGDELTIDAGKTLTTDGGGRTLTLAGTGTPTTLDLYGTCTIAAGDTLVTAAASDPLLSIRNGGELVVAGDINIPATSVPNWYIWAGGTLNIDATPTSFRGIIDLAGDMEVSATIDFSNVDFSSGGATITFDSAAGNPTLTTGMVTLPDIEVNNAGTVSFTAQDTVICTGFALTAGVYTDGGFNHIIRGDVSIAGTLTSTGVWRADDPGDWVNATSANAFAEFQVQSTATLTGTACAKTVSGGGVIDVDGNVLSVYQPAANFWTFSGTVSDTAGGGSIDVTLSASVANAARIEAPAADFNVTGDDFTLTATAGIEVGAVTILSLNVAKYAKLALGISSRMGTVVLGDAAANNKQGRLACGPGSTYLLSLAGGNAANAAGNEVDLENCYFECVGNADFTNIALQSATVDNVVHMNFPAGGFISVFDPVEVVHVHGDPDVDNDSGAGPGANNTVNGVTTFNTERMPWQITCGVT